jgi:hypothetical protein
VRSEAGQPSKLVTEFGPGWGLPLGVHREAINMSDMTQEQPQQVFAPQN